MTGRRLEMRGGPRDGEWITLHEGQAVRICLPPPLMPVTDEPFAPSTPTRLRTGTYRLRIDSFAGARWLEWEGEDS